MPSTTGSTEKINARTLYSLFVETFKNNIKKVSPPVFQVKYLSLLKKLLAEQGEETTKEYIVFFIENYAYIKGRLRLSGYPNISVLWAFRSTILEYMNEPRKNSIKYSPTTIEASSGEKAKSNTGAKTDNYRVTKKQLFLGG